MFLSAGCWALFASSGEKEKLKYLAIQSLSTGVDFVVFFTVHVSLMQAAQDKLWIGFFSLSERCI